MSTQRRFASVDISVPPLGMGTWATGGPLTVDGRGYGRARQQADQGAVLDHAIAQGLRFFDTADAYGDGLAEQRLGRALRRAQAAGPADGVATARYVCTKFGNRIAGGQFIQDFSAAHLQAAVDASLQRLERDTLDILLLHSPPADFDWARHDRTPYEALVAQGKIRSYGVSCRSVAAAAGVVQAGFGSVLEVVYNVLDRRAQALFAPACQAGYDLITRMPLAYGLLLAPADTVYPAGDHRASIAAEERAWIAAQRARLHFLDALPGGMAVSALRFAFSDPAIATAIAGVSSTAQVDAAVQAIALGPLPADIAGRIAASGTELYRTWSS